MSQEYAELAVVGGGIGGLGFAHMMRRKGVSSLVLEADSQVGGCLCSHVFPTPDGPYWTELGAHTCFNSYGHLLAILDELGQLETLTAKQRLSYRMWVEGNMSTIPSQLGWFELLRSLPNVLRVKREGLTAGDYFRQIVGPANFRQVVGPALNAVICQPSDDFPADALFRKKPRRKEVVRSFTSPGGVVQFANAVAMQEGVSVLSEAQVVSLEQIDSGFLVQTADGREVRADRVALAVAPDVVANLIDRVVPEAAVLLREIRMADIETVSVVVPSQELASLPPMAGLIAADDDFYSVVTRDPLPDPNYRGFAFHFRPQRLGAKERELRVCEVLGIQSEQWLGCVHRLNRLPSLRLGHPALIEKLDRLLAKLPLAVTGNWFYGVSIEDTLTRSAKESERLCALTS